MALKERFESTGNWLFRWRGFLPLLTIGIFMIAMRHFSYPRGEHSLDLLWESLAFAVSLFGLTIRIFTVGYAPKGTSSRTTSRPKASILSTTGMYSIVRHPLYLGNFFIWVGVLMCPRFLFFAVAGISLFFLYYGLIILAEEKVLREKFGDTFREWAYRTPPLFPKFRNWQKAVLPFSLKTVLKREYSTFFAIITAFTCIEIGGDLFYSGRLEFDPVWMSMFLIGLCSYVILRILKKKGLLNVEGR